MIPRTVPGSQLRVRPCNRSPEVTARFCTVLIRSKRKRGFELWYIEHQKQNKNKTLYNLIYYSSYQALVFKHFFSTPFSLKWTLEKSFRNFSVNIQHKVHCANWRVNGLLKVAQFIIVNALDCIQLLDLFRSYNQACRTYAKLCSENVWTKCTVRAPVFGTLNSAISNYQTWLVRSVMENIAGCRKPATCSVIILKLPWAFP